MSKIVTISREFGSGGREIGKRLAEQLGVAYYDNEIISGIVQHSQLAEDYVNRIVEKKAIRYFPIRVGRSFSIIPSGQMDMETKVYLAQIQVIKELAEKTDCVIIGRCADYILSDKKPFRVLIYANMDFKTIRCMEKGNDNLGPKEIQQKIQMVEKNRARYYEFFTGQKWGDKRNFDLCINTSAIKIKSAVSILLDCLEDKI